MYEANWGFAESPFQNTVDPCRYYPSQSHDEALARVLFLIDQRRRCGLVCGPAGTGKSLLLALVKHQLRRAQQPVALVDLSGLARDEFLCQLAAALNVGSVDGDLTTRQWRRIHDHLHGLQLCGEQVVVLLDHLEGAAASCRSIFERLLHSGGRPNAALTILVATRSLNPTDCPATLLQLSDLRIELSPLDASETSAYVTDLLRKAGCQHEVFDADALRTVFERTHGVPREINRLCDLSLLAAMAERSETVSSAMVEYAADALAVHPAESATTNR